MATVSGLSGAASGKRMPDGLWVSIRDRDASNLSAPPEHRVTAAPTGAPLPKASPRPPDAESPLRSDARSSCHPLLAYYLPSQLTKKPRVIRDLASRDPRELAGRPESGRLLAELCIEEDGRVSKVRILESDLPQLFTEVTERNFGEVLFAPGEIDGNVVRSAMRIEVRFAPPVPVAAPAAIERVPLPGEAALTPASEAAEN